MGWGLVGRNGRSQSSGWLVATLVVVAAAMISASYTRHLSRLLLDRSEALRNDASPSVQRLVDARSAMLELESAALAISTLPEAARAERLSRMQQARQSAGRAIGAYLALPPFAGEPPMKSELTLNLAALDDALKVPLEPSELGPLIATVAKTDAVLGRLIHFEVSHATEEVALIERTWRRSELALAGLALLLACLAAMAALLALRRYTRRLEARSSELELFAGRVAHDVQSPLSAVSIAVELLLPPAEVGGLDPDHPQRRLAERALASLRRVHAIVEGLLDFARSGAEPDRRRSAEVSEVLSGVLAELAGPAEEANITVEAAPVSPCRVVCAPGVLASVISNLARNAIEHMDDRKGASTERRVTLQVVARRERVRIEVDDTGPGVPRGWEELVFQPYLRGPGSGQRGIGLGLATVKQLVEAHAGAVGLSPSPQGGARFWFELPRAPELRPPSPRAHHDQASEARIS